MRLSASSGCDDVAVASTLITRDHSQTSKNKKKKVNIDSLDVSPLPPFFLSFFPSPGESGLGKSTLINSLFLTDLYSAEYPGPSHRIKKTVQVPLDT